MFVSKKMGGGRKGISVRERGSSDFLVWLLFGAADSGPLHF